MLINVGIVGLVNQTLPYKIQLKSLGVESNYSQNCRTVYFSLQNHAIYKEPEKKHNLDKRQKLTN